MTINNQTIHGGNQQFSNSPGIEQEVMDALREQAECSCRNHYFNIDAILKGNYDASVGNFSYYANRHWRDYLTPKAAALYVKMEASQNNNQ